MRALVNLSAHYYRVRVVKVEKGTVLDRNEHLEHIFILLMPENVLRFMEASVQLYTQALSITLFDISHALVRAGTGLATYLG